MKTATLTRTETSDQGTFGVLVTDSGFRCVTGELPWAFNVQGRSCILFGTFNCNYRFSEKHQKNVYHIDDVPGRTDVEIHSGNFCGDRSKNLKSDVLGCCLLGKVVGYLDNQKAVLESKDTVEEFEKEMNGEDFQLSIVWAKPEETPK